MKDNPVPVIKIYKKNYLRHFDTHTYVVSRVSDDTILPKSDGIYKL